jgi:hypothetical protein
VRHDLRLAGVLTLPRLDLLPSLRKLAVWSLRPLPLLVVSDQGGQRRFSRLQALCAHLQLSLCRGQTRLALRQALLELLDEMRQARTCQDVPRSHDDPSRCRHCGVRHACGGQALS